MNNKNILYIELKSCYNDNGPAWIGKCEYSKSKQTIYFNNKALHTSKGQGIKGNYYDAETGDEYWISGIKKNQEDRHWAGSGKIKVDKSILKEYLNILRKENLDKNKYEIFTQEQGNVKERVNKLLNEKLDG